MNHGSHLTPWDVTVVGGGPAGSVCAALCAAGGLRVVLLEREQFPREKVCGDCLNPNCWSIFEALQLAERVKGLAHGNLRMIRYRIGQNLPFEIPIQEIAVPRSALDQLLLAKAKESGVTLFENSCVESLDADGHAQVQQKSFPSQFLIAADGRNSRVARASGFLWRADNRRVALQAHLPLPCGFANSVEMRLLREGYCGVADVGDNRLNLCMVSQPAHIAALKARLAPEFFSNSEPAWRTVTPLARTAIGPAKNRLLLVGDAARVVEPFTGEGLYYALRSGQLAAEAILESLRSGQPDRAVDEYRKQHRALYAGRLGINLLARFASKHPVPLELLSRARRPFGAMLTKLTQAVVQPSVKGESTIPTTGKNE